MKKLILSAITAIVLLSVANNLKAQVIKTEEVIKLINEVARYRYNKSDSTKQAVEKAFFPLIAKGFVEVSFMNSILLVPQKITDRFEKRAETVFKFADTQTKDTISISLYDYLRTDTKGDAVTVTIDVVTRDYVNYQKWLETTAGETGNITRFLWPDKYGFYKSDCGCYVTLSKPMIRNYASNNDRGMKVEKWHLKNNPGFTLTITLNK